MTINTPSFIQTTSSKRLPIWVNIISLIFISLFLGLSYWQLHRGQTKQAIIHSLQTSSQNQIIDAQQLISATETLPIGQEVNLQGQFDSEHFFLLENKMHQGQVGFNVISALKLNSKVSILVHRGWINREAHSQGRIRVAPIPETVTIRGQLYRPKHNIFISRNMIEKQWPQFALEVDIASFEERLGTHLFPMVVNLHNDSGFSFTGPAPLGNGLLPERHFGYSIQWLLFAVILAAIWIYNRFIRSQS